MRGGSVCGSNTLSTSLPFCKQKQEKMIAICPGADKNFLPTQKVGNSCPLQSTYPRTTPICSTILSNDAALVHPPIVANQAKTGQPTETTTTRRMGTASAPSASSKSGGGGGAAKSTAKTVTKSAAGTTKAKPRPKKKPATKRPETASAYAASRQAQIDLASQWVSIDFVVVIVVL